MLLINKADLLLKEIARTKKPKSADYDPAEAIKAVSRVQMMSYEKELKNKLSIPLLKDIKVFLIVSFFVLIFQLLSNQYTKVLMFPISKIWFVG